MFFYQFTHFFSCIMKTGFYVSPVHSCNCSNLIMIHFFQLSKNKNCFLDRAEPVCQQVDYPGSLQIIQFRRLIRRSMICNESPCLLISPDLQFPFSSSKLVTAFIDHNFIKPGFKTFCRFDTVQLLPDFDHCFLYGIFCLCFITKHPESD